MKNKNEHSHKNTTDYTQSKDAYDGNMEITNLKAKNFTEKPSTGTPRTGIPKSDGQ